MRITRAIAAAAAVVVIGLTAAPVAVAVDYVPGDNPMCSRVSLDDESWKKQCLAASDTNVTSGSTIRFTGRYPLATPGVQYCLARSPQPYGDFTGIAACSTINKNGTIGIAAMLGKRGTYYVDLGLPGCLAKAPADRSPSKCGDSGGMMGTPVKVTVR